MPDIIIKNSGAMSTIQDLGRYGYQKMGMPPAGYMDCCAARCANLLVGNDENAALIEATLTGPVIEFTAGTLFAVTGADMEAELSGVLISRWRPYYAVKGEALSLKTAKSGVRAYIAFSGGMDVPIVMGSRSTYIKGGIGGHMGRAVKTGDILKLFKVESHVISSMESLEIPVYGDKITVRAVRGPHEEYFTEEGLRSFFSKPFNIGSRSDRMGIFLEGISVKLSGDSTDILSQAVMMGSVQVTSEGTPVVLMADRQTTGGYAQIAAVITADLWKLAQARPGTEVRFEEIGITEAHEAYREYESGFNRLKHFIGGCKAVAGRRFNININGNPYKAIVEEIL